MSRKPSVVVTGLGVVSSIGIGWRAYWDALLSGTSGISEVAAFDTSNFPTHLGGQVKSFRVQDFIDGHLLGRYNRTSQLAIAASKLALSDAGFDGHRPPSDRIAVVVGTTMAEAQAIEAIDSAWVSGGDSRIRARLAAQYPSSSIPSNVAMEIGAGQAVALGTACAAGNYAIMRGSDLLLLDRADLVLAGGADAFSRIAFTGFNRLMAMAPDRCQPFDRNRKGMMLGEGAGFLVLEREKDAAVGGGKSYARLLGCGVSCDASHMTIPDVDGVQRVLERTLAAAGIEPRDVDYINAHGTGTPANDRNECRAIRSVFKSHTDHMPMSSIKSMLGHSMGAASALEAIACVLAIVDQRVPPTMNFEEPDPECDIDCVPNQSRAHAAHIVLNNSFAFGGNNACTVFSGLAGMKTLTE
jgi:3-oxoacyl-[acyl-carrier-protein] synthase II